MQIAVISPVSHLQYCNYGDIHMSLAHLVMANLQYAEYYREISLDLNQFVILDNSAFEFEQQGIGVTLATIFEAVRRIKPHEVIATDTLFKGPETVESTKAFIKAIPADLRGTFKIMAVPQGRSKEEWFTCLEGLLDIPEVTTIGLSKLSIPSCWEGTHQKSGVVAHSRVECVRQLSCQWHWADKLHDKEIHLLGGDDWSAWELYHYRDVESLKLRSCDSSVTVWYGANNVRFDPNTGTMSQYILEKPDLENKNSRTAEYIDINTNNILHNIAVLHRFSKPQ